jgi:hypothetical protein
MRTVKPETASEALRRPNELLDKLVAANVELIYERDLSLGAALDVAPPSVEVSRPAQPTRSGDSRGATYRAARKFYRKLKNNQQLKPLLERVRHEILTRI